MVQMPVSEFKTHCLSVLTKMERDGKPLLLTRHGKAVAEVRPPQATRRKSWIGSMKGTAKIVGNIVAPTGVKWDAEG